MDLMLGDAGTGVVAQAAEDLIAQPARARQLGLLPLTAGLGGRVLDLVYARERGFLAASQRSCMRLKLGVAAVEHYSHSRVHEKWRSL